MESVHFFSFVLLVLVSAKSVYSLSCYNCSSLIDPKCGVEWKFSADSDAYRIECPKNATHCFKRVTLPHRPHPHAFRGCWEPWENYTITRKSECTELGTETEVCFCAGSSCNGQNTLSATIPEILAGTLLSFIAIFY